MKNLYHNPHRLDVFSRCGFLLIRGDLSSINHLKNYFDVKAPYLSRLPRATVRELGLANPCQIVLSIDDVARIIRFYRRDLAAYILKSIRRDNACLADFARTLNECVELHARTVLASGRGD